MTDEDTFARELSRLKRSENPEAVLLVADDPVLMKIVVAWSGLDVRKAAQPSAAPCDGSLHEASAWLWTNTRYSLSELSELSGLTIPVLEHKLKPLILGHILYPDGTVNSFVQRYLRERVLRLFDSKPRKPARSS